MKVEMFRFKLFFVLTKAQSFILSLQSASYTDQYLLCNVYIHAVDLIIPKVIEALQNTGLKNVGAISVHQFISIFFFDLKWCFCCNILF